MTAKEFLEENGIPNIPTQITRDEQTGVSDTAEALEAYHQAKLKLLGIANAVGKSEQFKCDNGCDWYSVGHQLNGHQQYLKCGKQKAF